MAGARARGTEACPAAVRVTGPWNIEVSIEDRDSASLAVAPGRIERVERERHDQLPLFNAKAPGWKRGQRLLRCEAQETSVKGGVVPGSLNVYADEHGRTPFEAERDYSFDDDWATIGRRPDGRVGEEQSVWLSYRYGLARIDTVVLDGGGQIGLRSGRDHVCVPGPPALEAGDRALANIWISSRLERLHDDSIFPILEHAFPKPAPLTLAEARARLPRTWGKLEAGETLHVLAWGDSVTNGGFLREHEGFPAIRWQDQFVERLRKRFPEARVELATASWPGKQSRDFVNAPEGSPHHYPTAILAANADLIVSEFVNDAYLHGHERVEEAYGRFLEDFRRFGAEWIILTPHYVRPDWMALQGEKNIDDDPRPYVAGLRAFARDHGIPLADASRRWGRLWRQGIPYTTLLLNAINHPDERGMRIFADSLMELFPDLRAHLAGGGYRIVNSL